MQRYERCSHSRLGHLPVAPGPSSFHEQLVRALQFLSRPHQRRCPQYPPGRRTLRVPPRRRSPPDYRLRKFVAANESSLLTAAYHHPCSLLLSPCHLNCASKSSPGSCCAFKNCSQS